MTCELINGPSEKGGEGAASSPYLTSCFDVRNLITLKDVSDSPASQKAALYLLSSFHSAGDKVSEGNPFVSLKFL